MMVTYRSRFLTRAEVWYDNEPDDTPSVDWILYFRRSHPIPGATTKLIYTYAIDLTKSHDQLLVNLNKDTAYKIRRARERDHILCKCCNPRDETVINQFEQMYNTFATVKGLAPLDRTRMESMAVAGVLDMSVAEDQQGNALVYHANYRDRHRATSMELPSLYRKLSDSAERNFIGRANRYLTWSDILRYQEQGLKCFDFGGWYQGNDPEMLKINDFKKGFGGQVVREYQCERILTMKGWAVLHAAGLLKQARLLSSRPKEQAVTTPTDLATGQVPVSTD